MTPTNRFEEPPKRIASYYNKALNEGHEKIVLNDDWKAFYKRMTGNYEDVVYEDFKRRYMLINHKS
ncbi:MAG: hypothetical protein U5P41_09050 [Gammaproteobacteria bacterium]|nr:hypothetical protein [Gammaproteobacteria bacterium]